VPRLGVNIDHVATVRQARRTFEPDPAAAALAVEQAGAHGITLHLREDRRHIQDRDLELILRLAHTHVNLEMASTQEMLALACLYHPDEATLVPEKREEVTTEGGLDVSGNLEHLTEMVFELSSAGILASAFIDPEPGQAEACKSAGFKVVEFHTGAYANAKPQDREEELGRLETAAVYAQSLELEVAAGHGLTYYNVVPLVKLGLFEEFNIGHSIIARAILTGLDRAVREMLALVTRSDDVFHPERIYRIQNL
jgi:pyridoxine 5-phosphate synthase